MNEQAISAITDFMASRSEKAYKKGTDDYEILRYGVAVLYYFVVKTLLLIVVSFFLGILSYALAFMAVFGGLRRFGKGLHFKSNAVCTAVGFANYIIGIFLAIYLKMGLLPTIIIYILCFVINCVYAPSPTENSPIKESDRLPLKIKTLVVMAVLFVIMLFVGERAGANLGVNLGVNSEASIYRNIILIATTTHTVYVLPLTYKIFGERRE